MVATALIMFDIALLLWCSIEDLRSMQVDVRWLRIFMLVSLGYAIYTGEFTNIILAAALYVALKIIPHYKVGVGDQQIFAGLMLQFGLMPVTLILIFSFAAANIFARGREIPFIPVIFGVFLAVLHYTTLLGTIQL